MIVPRRLRDIICDADVFIGVSVPGALTAEMVRSMAADLNDIVVELYPREEGHSLPHWRVGVGVRVVHDVATISSRHTETGMCVYYEIMNIVYL